MIIIAEMYSFTIRAESHKTPPGGVVQEHPDGVAKLLRCTAICTKPRYRDLYKYSLHQAPLPPDNRSETHSSPPIGDKVSAQYNNLHQAPLPQPAPTPPTAICIKPHYRNLRLSSKSAPSER